MFSHQRSRVKTRLFLSYSSAFAVLLTLVFGIGYTVFANKTISARLEIHETVSRQMSAAISEQFARPLRVAIQFNSSKWVERMMYLQKSPDVFNEKTNALDIREQYQQIKLMEVSVGTGEQIGLYFALVDKAISNYGQSSWKDYCAFYHLETPDNVLAGPELLQQNNQQTILPHCYMNINGERKMGYIYLQTLPLTDFRNGNVNMFYFLPVDALSAQAHSYYHSREIGLYLTSKNDVYTSLSDTEATLNNAEIKRLIALASADSASIYDTEQKAYCMLLPLTQIGGSILVVMPKSLLADELYNVQRLMTLLFVAVFVLALLFSVFLADQGYRPIKRLASNIALDIRPGTVQQGEPKNEYSMIELAIRTLGQQKRHLDEMVEAQSDIVQRYTILQAIRTDMSTGGSVQELSAIIPHPFYCLFVLHKPATDSQPSHLLPFAETDNVWYMDVETAQNHLIVASYPRLETLGELRERIRHDGTVKMGCSEDQTDVAAFPNAYSQALAALQYHYLLTGRSLIRFEDVRLRQQTKASLKGADTSALKCYLQNADGKAAVQELSQIISLLVNTRLISLQEFFTEMEALTRQLTDLLQEMSKACPVQDAPRPERYDSVTIYENALTTWLKEQLRGVGNMDQRFASTSMHITDYIQEHLVDPNLSQTEIAEALGYTPSYFSRYFKEHFNENYHDYITARRIGLAKELMNECDDSIQEIAVRVGFSNDATFRRVFKNLQGISPRQYMQRRHKG